MLAQLPSILPSQPPLIIPPGRPMVSTVPLPPPHFRRFPVLPWTSCMPLSAQRRSDEPNMKLDTMKPFVELNMKLVNQTCSLLPIPD